MNNPAPGPLAGYSLEDYALAALQGLLAQHDGKQGTTQPRYGVEHHKLLAERAFDIAERMKLESEKRGLREAMVTK